MSARRLNQVYGVSLADQARESIRTAILDGTIAPEERITIEDLAADLGISRTPIREALKALEGDGLVELLPHRGAIVSRFARDELDHRYSVRAMLEGYAAELACQLDAAAMTEVLRANVLRARKLAERPSDEVLSELVELNLEFHAAIREGSGSTTVIRILDQLRNPVAFSLGYWSDDRRRQNSIEAHTDIVAAFANDDPARARQLTEAHLLKARDLLVAQHDEQVREAEERGQVGTA